MARPDLRSRFSSFLPALLLGLALAPTASADTLHVDEGLNSGANDGSSWANAYQGIDGLAAALSASVAGDDIYVAEGTYRPTSTGTRTLAFALKTGVEVYGGFAGGEASPAERPAFGTAESILTGDLAGDDDGLGGNIGENSYHVVTSPGADATAVLDGFVITSGFANGAGNNDSGAGILCTNGSSPTIRLCRFTDNRCTFGGAAGYIISGAAPSFTDVIFENGDGGAFGGAFDIAGGGAVRYERCLFRNNTAARGGALEIFSTNGVVVNNCVFTGNVATGSGGGGGLWMGTGGNTQVRNCTIVGNTSTVNNVGGLRTQSSAGTTVVNCVIWGNIGPGSATTQQAQMNLATNATYCVVMGTFAGTGNVDTDPLFADAPGDDFTLTAGSSAVDAGNNNAVPGGTLVDFAGNDRFVDDAGTVDTGVGSAPIVDMGAFEFAPGGSPFTDLGNGLAGTSGEPVLELTGTLVGGTTVNLSLTNAAPASTAFFVVGSSALFAPIKGGILVPAADVVVGLGTGAGTLAFGFGWPVGVPPGFGTWYQAWVQDAGGPSGFAASNGVVGTTP